ncbi:complex I subunit 4 family protein [Rhodopirellula sp. JC639]|uniref:complex I subunit 4 family protein n=1 Tax=Stieleria mannarensis TaxID=2755585 RepID=UPI001600C20C|nr:NADH-quinone oxidoreductase subunit M [Rhodopirellula sp. JC639]
MSWLSLLILIPLATALGVVVTPESKWYARRWIALWGTGIVLALSFVMSATYMQAVQQRAGDASLLTVSKMEFEHAVPWFSSMGIEYHVGVDGISMAMIVLTAIIIFTGVLASWDVKERSREFFAFLLVLVTGVFGVFISVDLFLFFVFYEVAVLPMYLLIGVWGTGRKEYSAMKLTLMLMVGSAFVLVGLLALYHAAGAATFDLNKLAMVDYSADLQSWVFPCVFVGFGVLGALFPFHTWSPDGHASAPTAVSMLHAGVLMKLGGYGVLRVAVYLMPEGAKQWALFFLVLTTINIVYGAYAAIKQTDLKYFTAYSSVSHCGFVLFGLCSLNLMGFKGAVIQMFSHGIMTGLFFGLIGMVYGRSKTRDLTKMGGLSRRMPWLATSFYIGGLASLGLPGLSGFVAESTVFLGGFFGNRWVDSSTMRVCTLLATSSIVVTAVYVLRGLARVFQGKISNPQFNQLDDATVAEKLCTGILVATLAIVGMYPPVLIDLIEHAIVPIVNRF